MAWIESHEDLGNHPKVYALMTALNVDKRSAVGALHLLWHFTLKFAWQTGDLSKYPALAIARACDETGDPDQFVKALQDSGWLDEMMVHDWMDYAGKIVRDRIYNAKRRSTPLNDVNPRKTAATVPNRTVPNLTEPKTKTTDIVGVGAFEELWKLYPNKDGKDKARERFLKTVKTSDQIDQIKKALTNYLASDRVKRGFVKNGSTWFGTWTDWVDYVETSQHRRQDGLATATPGKYPDELG